MSSIFDNLHNEVQHVETKDSKPKAMFYLNVGTKIEKEFISIPLGIALDTMQKVDLSKIGSKSPEQVAYKKKMAYSNAILEKLIEAAQALEEGEEKEIKLTCVLRRARSQDNVNDEADLDLSKIKF